MYDVITVGSATIDVFTKTDQKYFKKVEYCFPINSKILAESLEIHTGGGGTNVAVSLAKFGLKTAYIGKIGTLANSERVLRKLKKERVDTSLVCREKGRTAFSVILDAKGHDRTIIVFKGSADDLSFREINKRKLKTKWFYFCSMMKRSFKAMVGLAKFAEENRINILFNPSSYMIKNYNLKPVLRRTNVLIFNMEEAMVLTKIRDSKKIKKIMKAIYKMGPKGIVITDGKKRIYAYDGDIIYELQPKKNTRIVETTGAGDAFGAGFLAGLIKTNDMKKALKLGNMNAESCIKKTGAKEGLLTWGDVKNKL